MTSHEWLSGDFWYNHKVKWLRPKQGVEIYIWEHVHNTGTSKKYSVHVECAVRVTMIADDLPTLEEAIYFVENNLAKILSACEYLEYGSSVLMYLHPKYKAETKKKTDDTLS